MEKQLTLTMSKPGAVSSGQTGEIIRRLEGTGFIIRAMKMVRLSESGARAFYEVHADKPFYESLVRFMTEGPIVAMVLEREDAVAHLREVIGNTDPQNAADGTLRKDLAESKERNVIHASDSPENARIELSFFFSRRELLIFD